MARRRGPTRASLYDLRDLDIMFKLADLENGDGQATAEIAESLGFAAEEHNRNVGIRLAWMRRYGMLAFDDTHKLWSLSRGGQRVVQAHELAPSLRALESLPDEAMVDAMAQITSRFQRGETMLAVMLRREFLYGTKRRR
jgi:hypothetical protein